MPNELQELQLRVSLINEASEGVSRIRDDLKELATGAGKTAMDKLKEEQSELAKQIKELGELAEGGGRSLVGYIGKFGVAGAAMGGLAASILVGLGSLKEFADRVVDLTNKAKVIGMNPAELKSLIEQYDRLGVSAGTVEQSMAGLSNVLAQVNRIGSEKRMEMIKAAGQFGTLMEQGIQRIEAQATQAGKLQEIIRQSYVVYDERMKETEGNRADALKSQNDFLKLWEMDPVLKVLRHVEQVSEEEKKRFEARAKATADYKKTVSDLSHEVEELGADLSTALLGSGGVIVTGLHLMLDLVKELRELWKQPWTGTAEKPGGTAPTRPLTTKDLLGSVLGGQQGGATFEERWPSAPTKPASEQQPAGLMSAPAPGSIVSDQIPGVGKGWEWMRRSENIEDRREVDESMRQGDDYLKNIEKNTAETKRLNENFKLLDQGDVELKGLGGLPGFSKGAGGGFGGGGSTSSWGGGPNGSRVGPGVGTGASESHPGPGKGGGTSEQGGPVQLTDQTGKGIDGETMKEVEKLGRAGDVAGLQGLFAKKGYRMSGPACGIIASKYVTSAGFKPVASGAIATSWHKWGEKASPEDVNVADHPFGSMVGTYWHRRYGGNRNEILAPGQTGGHVMTIIPGSYDPKTGTVDVVDQYGYSHGKRSVSDLDIRFAGKEAVAAAAAKRGEDRTTVDATGAKSVRTVKVDVNGKLTADVKAPRGSDVKVEGGGAFSKTETNRTMPIESD
jgi:hypothetical protein